MSKAILLSSVCSWFSRRSFLIVMALWGLFAGSVYAKDQQVLLVYGDEKLAEYSISTLKQYHFFDGKRLHKIFYEDFSPDLYNIDSDALLITLGTAPAVKVAQYSLPYITYALFITETSHEYILSHYGNNKNIVPFYLDQPFDRQARFVKAVLPDTKEIAILYGPASYSLKVPLEKAFSIAGVSVVSEQITNEQESANAIEKLLSHRIPVLAIPDSIAFSPNNAKWLLYMAYQRSIPVIGFSASYTRAGAVASIFSTPKHILREFVETIADKTSSRKSYFPRYYDIETNDSVIRSLKLHSIDKEKVLEEVEKGG